MIIVSQDKRDVLNFDFTQRIGLDRETNFTSIVAYQNGNAEAECLWLGSYKTEERAKEVLIGIMQSRIDSENYKYVNALMTTEELNRLQKGLVYEMPED